MIPSALPTDSDCIAIKLYDRELLKFCVGKDKECNQSFTFETVLTVNASALPVSLCVNDTIIELSQGDIALTPGKATLISRQKHEAEFTIVQIALPEQLLREYNQFNSTRGYQSFSLSKPVLIKKGLVTEFLFSFFPYFSQPGLRCEKLLKFKLFELLFLLENVSHEKIFVPAKPSEVDLSVRLAHVLNQNLFNTDISIDKMASLTGMSVSTFKRRFKEAFNTPMRQWLTAKRIEKAEYLLKTTTLSIKEIAYECGFATVSYFIKQYKKVHGTTPNARRQAF